MDGDDAVYKNMDFFLLLFQFSKDCVFLVFLYGWRSGVFLFA